MSSSLRAFDLVAVPAGEFAMGSSIDEVDACVSYWKSRLLMPSYELVFRDWILKEYPKHRQRVDSFHISRFPVTNGEYRVFIEHTSRSTPESISIEAPADHPVWGVSFDDAALYAQWMTERTNRVWRLPSEVEWEYAARGPSGREYPYGPSFDAANANTLETGIGSTTPVDRFAAAASEYGVIDMAGNVEEWTASFYAPYTGGQFIADDLSRTLGRYRVLRGGSFALGGDLTRCARRHGPHVGPLFRYRGFRLVVT